MVVNAAFVSLCPLSLILVLNFPWIGLIGWVFFVSSPEPDINLNKIVVCGQRIVGIIERHEYLVMVHPSKPRRESRSPIRYQEHLQVSETFSWCCEALRNDRDLNWIMDRQFPDFNENRSEQTLDV